MASSSSSTSTSDGINILIVNPNSTDAFTQTMKSSLLPLFPPSTYPTVNLQFITGPPTGPPSINSVLTSVLSASHTLPLIQSHLNTHPLTSAILIACFSAHPLIPMLRELTSIPVVGIMQSSILFGSQLGGRVGVVTTDARWEPLLTHEIHAEGMSDLCAAGVVSSGLAVLDLERLPKEVVLKRLVSKAKEMVEGRGADVLILGCAGMVGLDTAIQNELYGVEVLDPVRCGVEMCLAMGRAGMRTSKRGFYEKAEI